MDMQIDGLRVLVTAGAGGIRARSRRAFQREGARVFICDVDRAALDALATSDPGIGQCYCDVADREQVAALFRQASAYLGGLDVLVNNAGIAGPTARVEDVTPEDWDRCIAVCLTSQYNCARLAVPLLKQSKNASIINLSSAAGKNGFAPALTLCCRQMGGGRLHQVAGNRTRRIRHPRECHPAGAGGGRPHPPRA